MSQQENTIFPTTPSTADNFADFAKAAMLSHKGGNAAVRSALNHPQGTVELQKLVSQLANQQGTILALQSLRTYAAIQVHFMELAFEITEHNRPLDIQIVPQEMELVKFTLEEVGHRITTPGMLDMFDLAGLRGLPYAAVRVLSAVDPSVWGGASAILRDECDEKRSRRRARFYTEAIPNGTRWLDGILRRAPAPEQTRRVIYWDHSLMLSSKEPLIMARAKTQPA